MNSFFIITFTLNIFELISTEFDSCLSRSPQLTHMIVEIYSNMSRTRESEQDSTKIQHGSKMKNTEEQTKTKYSVHRFVRRCWQSLIVCYGF